ncbi:hypothetical protein DBR11_13160 [Pedobacter sp. HMWF019]|uniref:hypothetical protein n=1 Tax=Pedobacter sp. HMWF019 TaxID=2056856 RepID=UPI000D38C196|nr:hypothetical protein [Pedobacter sp. HMWF019]PTS99128.1 hypothetical protein DBR11_13160 [Pedobacter sp. HMWF019]
MEIGGQKIKLDQNRKIYNMSLSQIDLRAKFRHECSARFNKESWCIAELYWSFLKDYQVGKVKKCLITVSDDWGEDQTYVDLYFITNDTTVKINKSTIGIYGEKFKINELKNLDTTSINEIICSKVEFDKDN